MKKISLIILCIIMSLVFISCDNKNVSDENSSSPKNQITFSVTSENKIEEDDSDTEKELIYKNKNVQSFKFMYDDLAIDINIDENILKDIETTKCNETNVDAKLTSLFGNAEIIYEDGTKEVIGTIFIGKDQALYLKFNNNKNKDAAYKITDSSFINGLF